jgi:hypothetical protein
LVDQTGYKSKEGSRSVTTVPKPKQGGKEINSRSIEIKPRN